MSNLADLVDIGAGLGADRAAFITDEEVITYGELTDRIAAARGGLRALNVERGDRVAVSQAYPLDFAVAFYAALGIGAIAVPMNPALTAREAAHQLRDSGAKTLIATSEGGEWTNGTDISVVDVGTLRRHPAHADKVAVSSSDTAAILYTSGTTGAPKGAELTHGNLLFNAEVLGETAVLGPAADDVVAGILPPFHTMGLTVLGLALRAGAAVWPMAKFDARRVAELIDARKITILVGVPTHLQMLMHNSTGLTFSTPLERLSTAGAALPQAVRVWAEKRFGVPVIVGYGLTEAAPAVAYNRTDRPLRTSSVGPVLPGVQVKIVAPDGSEVPVGEVGEIAVRGPNVMKGYWGNPIATDRAIRDGWLYTGDVGRLDADNHLYVVDRLKQLIIRGGFNVYPGEVESVLQDHPAVTESAVVGVPDDRVGEEIVAFIVSAGPQVSEAELRNHVSANLAAYKTPRRFIFTSQLPRTPTGKVARSVLPSLADAGPKSQ
ncbi:class I adenylate-forming enzyme family protein [Nocardia sp. NPDC004750]